MNKRDNIFSRLNLNAKNTNMELEVVLDEKKFSEDIQSLILSMFYKIENAYTDYYTVKRNMPNKEIYIEKIIDTIKTYCNCIEIIKTKGTRNEKKYKVDSEKGVLYCLENEDVLLLGLFELINLDSNTGDLLENSLSEILKHGNSLNYQETIRAFNGWSWQDTLDISYDIQINLLYQNLLMLLEYDKLQYIIANNKKIHNIQKVFQENYGNKLANEITKYLLMISSSIKANKNKEFRIKFENYINSLKEELNKIDNSDELIVYITDRRKKITAEIGDIDKKLNNIEYLKKDFEERNKKLKKNKKIFSISSLAEMYEIKRDKLLKEMKECSMLVEPKKYINKKDELKNNLNIFEKIDFIQDKSINVEKILLEFQEIFLECFEDKINKCTEKKQIINLIYNFRYYLSLNYKKGYKINNCKKIKNKLNYVFKILVSKAENLKAIEICSNNIECNMEIIKNIFTNEIINLENIIVQINVTDSEENLYNIQYYDGTMLIKEIKLKLKNVLNKKKKIRLFI